MKKFFIKTFGCKTNQIESQIIENRLIKAGYEKSEKDFEILLVNSCTVTNVADSKCLQFLRAAKNNKPKVKTVLLGCMAQYKKEELKKHGFIDLILGNEEKLQIEKYLSFDEKYVVGDIFKVKEFQNYEIEKLSRTDTKELVRLRVNLEKVQYNLQSGLINDPICAYEKAFLEEMEC